MSEATTRTYIESVVSGIANVGEVHDYQRWAVQWPDFLEKFKTTISNSTVIRGWTISCQGWSAQYLPGSEPDENSKNIVVREYVYKIRGFFGVDDANESEKTAVAIVEDVCEALDADAELHEQQYLWDKIPPAQLDTFEYRMFGSVLCHYAEITQVARETVAQ